MTAGWSVAITYGGVTERVESVPGDISESMDLFEDSYDPRSFSTALVFHTLDWGRVYARGHKPGTAYGRVYDTDGNLVLAGRVRSANWGRIHEPVRLTITEEPWLEPVLFPPSYEVRYTVLDHAAIAQLQADTGITITPPTDLRGDPQTPLAISALGFSIYAEKVAGRVGPIVFGAPGYQDGATWPAVPAFFVDTGSGTEKLLIAWHAVEATEVTIYGPCVDGEVHANVCPVVIGEDAYGRRVSFADISTSIASAGSTDFVADLEGDWYSAWHAGPALPGGAGDVLAYMLLQTGARVDVPRLLSIRRELNAYEVAGFIDRTLDVWEWLIREFRVFPIAWVVGADGLYVWRYDPDADPVARFDEDAGFVLDGDAGESGVDPVRRIDLRFRHREDTGERIEVASPVTLHTRLAGQLGGAIQEIDSTIIDSRAVAERCAIERQRPFSAKHAKLQGVVRRSHLGHVRTGQVVTVHAPSVGVYERRGLVVRRVDSMEELLSYTVLVLEDVVYPSDAAAPIEVPFAPAYDLLGSYSFPVDAWLFWHAMSGTRFGNSYTVGGTYTRIFDITGQGRHGVTPPPTASPSTSATVYTGREGNYYAPAVETTSGKQLEWTGTLASPQGGGLYSFGACYFGPTANTLANGYGEAYFTTGSAPVALWPEWGTTVAGGNPGRRMQDPMNNPFGPSWECPNGDNADTNSWRVIVVTCSVPNIAPGTTATWRILHVERYNDVISVYYDDTFTETQTMAGTPHARRALCAGVKLWGSHDAGGFIWHQRPYTDAEVRSIALAAVEQVAPNDVAAAAALL